MTSLPCKVAGGRRQRLLLHWTAVRDFVRTRVSKWIGEIVREAYIQADRNYYGYITDHEVIALAASWPFDSLVSLPDILSAVFWRSSGVFQKSCLGDMGSISDGMATLGPVVVAQHTFASGPLHPPP